MNRCLRNGVQGAGHGQRGPNGGAEKSAGAAERRGRADVDAPRDFAAQTNGKVRASQHRAVSLLPVCRYIVYFGDLPGVIAAIVVILFTILLPAGIERSCCAVATRVGLLASLSIK